MPIQRYANTTKQNVRKARFVQYFFVSIAALCLSVWTEDCVKYYIDGVLDRRACGWGQEYAQGGLEFCNSTLKANLALRAMLPEKKGLQMVNLKGDSYNSFYRGFKTRPMTIRRQECMKILKDML